MRGWSAFVKPLGQSAVGGMRPLMWSLLGAVTLVLLIACGNAANLLLARAASRTHELGVRATLGANRARVMRQMMTESLLIGLGGGMLGVLLAFGLVKGLVRLNPGNIPRLEDSSIDLRVLLFTVLVAVLTSVLFGILPALSVSRVNLVEFLKSGANRGAVGARGRVQSALIVAEVALVVMMLAGAGLLLHSYVNVERVPTGFSPSTISMSVHLYAQYAQRDQRQAFSRRLLEKMGAVPGVESAGMISNLPLDKSESGSMLWIEGNADRDQKLVGWRTVTEGYFPTMGIRLIEGRLFADGDRDGRAPVVVVNEAFVKAYLTGRDPVGRRVRTSDTSTPWRTVVGVVGNVRDSSLEAEAVPEVYLPLWQADGFGGSVVMRTRLPLADVATAGRTILRGIDPNLALTDVRSMGEMVSDATALRRFQTMLLTGFAVAALVLSLVGFYGLLSYGVKRRTAEIGLRIALGSSRARVLGMVVRQGLSLVLMGLGIGLVGALVLTRVLAGSLYGVKPVDPVTFVGVPALLLVVTVIASLIPGWRALGIEPVTALRSE
jgi:predicted permease